ncbi:predicted protein [Histoplasma mississippiense (nom. inval.)]|uniref:predicted protein n=1 Tax=Ajellomyces capsulatus (strain NAm1 / WU24) TaxID=2059318 RepID=UPI000157CC91|nr:predicted protein [Histoplasma mississippiense (nom. inval.)]EDN10092.1 predicted protein [Histoplasma mississippiense (nom. inval.)]
MAYRQPGLSRTLPKDFTFYAGDEENRPRTPDRPTKELTIPPPPHHSSCRFRRPRLTISTQRELFCSPDIPLPSIELSHDPSASVAGIFDGAVTQPMTENALQVPPRGRVDPRTPPAQIRGTPVDERPCWTYGDTGDCSHPIPRPSSACSNFSDSSAASSTSCMSYASMGGSCTSPEKRNPGSFHFVSLHQLQARAGDSFQAQISSTGNLDLCKRKFSIGPHYQRLLQSRSPSPFLETSPESATGIPLQLGVSHRKAASFATRDLGVSLVSSFLPTQVAELGPPTSDLNNGPQNDWFNNISRDHEQPTRTPKHFHSHSSSSLGDYSSHITTSSLCDEIPRLGSPFMYHTWGPDSSRRRLRSATPANQFGNAHKRRALHQLEDELDSSGSSLQRPFPDLIHQPRYNDNMGQRRVRVRNRGITTGAIGGSRGRLDQLFNPPAHFAEFRGSSTSLSTGTASTTSSTTVTATTTGASDDGQKMQPQDNNINNINNTSHHLRHGDDIKRLGSPFHSDPFNKYNNRKHLTPSHPPRHAPSLSDPFTSTSFASMPSATARNLEQRHPVLMSNCQETPNSESAMTTPRAYFDEERGGKGGSGVGMSVSAGPANGDGFKLDTLDTPNTPFS